jgi:hypothetical protein
VTPHRQLGSRHHQSEPGRSDRRSLAPGEGAGRVGRGILQAQLDAGHLHAAQAHREHHQDSRHNGRELRRDRAALGISPWMPVALGVSLWMPVARGVSPPR